ncbi:MAG TPA: glycosyltransferase family 4 protein [Actinoplanes sp.]|nr:glycosyltransferase family 4 protein [Actinoplanes sp.]
MKIRYVLNNAYVTGGTIRTVLNQANALCADHEVEVASVYRSRLEPSFDIDPRVRLVPLTDMRSDGRRRTDPAGQPSRLLARTRRYRNPLPHGLDFRYRDWDPVVDAALIRYFWAARSGVLITTRPALNLMSAYFAPKRLIRVAQDHMNFGSYKRPLRNAIVRAYRRLDAVTVLTEHDLGDYRQALGGTGVRLARIPNGIPPVPQLTGVPESKVLIAAGRLTRQKGFDLLIDAFAKVRARHPDWQLKIYGEGPLMADLRGRITALGLTDSAHLPGVTNKLPEELSAAGLFVLSSRFEGLPMVLLEAMTLGLPAVAFDCPTGPAEIIENGRNGLLIPPKDTGALADGICELIEDPDRRAAMRAAARESSTRYTMPAVRDLWEGLFADLAAARA